MIKKIMALSALCLSLCSVAAQATTYTYSAAQFLADIKTAQTTGGGTPQFSKDVQGLLNSLQLSSGAFQMAVPSQGLSGGGCSLSYSGSLQNIIASINPQSNIQLAIGALDRPIVATLDLAGQVDATGNVTGGEGFRVAGVSWGPFGPVGGAGPCIQVMSAHASANVDASFNFNLNIVFNLNPVYNSTTQTLTITPTVNISGAINNLDVALSNAQGYIASPFTGFAPFADPAGIFNGILSDAVAEVIKLKVKPGAKYQAWIAAQNSSIAAQLAAHPIAALDLSTITSANVGDIGLMYLADKALTLPVSAQYLTANENQLMLAALYNDPQMASAILTDDAACVASSQLRATMAVLPVYQKVGASCQVATITDSTSGIFYSDSACTKNNINQQTYASMCNEHVQSTIMGNPVSWGGTAVNSQSGWTRSYASEFQIGYDTLSNYSVPYYNRVNFKTVSPVYERKITTVYNVEAYNTAVQQCLANPGGYYPGASGQCISNLKQSDYYQVMPNTGTASIFNTYQFNQDVSDCTSALLAAYEANPSAYNYKYGYIGGSNPFATVNMTQMGNDCNTKLVASSTYQATYYVPINGYSTKVFRPDWYTTYKAFCAAAASQGGVATVNGTSVTCMPLQPTTAAVFQMELQQPIIRGNGTCSLEMRVFKKDPNATNLKPMIMFHGGAWTGREFGFTGIEAVMSYYTDHGYVVFAPFYRLADSKDANVECNGSYDGDMVKDSMDAFNWVNTNGVNYGATYGAAPTLFGQSSGSYFVGYIVGNTNATQVHKALMMYPPTDPQSYAVQYAQRVAAANASGVPMQQTLGDVSLEAFMDGSSLDLFAAGYNALPQVPAEMAPFTTGAQSFSLINLLKTGSHAPIYMVHGNADQLVPIQQSISLCNALGGSATTAGGTYACGQGDSHLAVVDKADHMLDLCIPGVVCPAANPAAAQAALDAAKSWLIQ